MVVFIYSDKKISNSFFYLLMIVSTSLLRLSSVFIWTSRKDILQKCSLFLYPTAKPARIEYCRKPSLQDTTDILTYFHTFTLSHYCRVSRKNGSKLGRTFSGCKVDIYRFTAPPIVLLQSCCLAHRLGDWTTGPPQKLSAGIRDTAIQRFSPRGFRV